MSALWSDTVHRLTPYVPGEQRAGDGIVKLNTNENPYPPSEAVRAAVAAVDGDRLSRYPDAESTALRVALADYHSLTQAQVFVGNGSDEVLALAFLAFFSGRGALQYPWPSYSFYPVYCALHGIEPAPLPLDAADGFELDPARFGNEGVAGIVFPNPNAPTGRAVPLAAIESLLQRMPDRVVLVDEAYADFGAQSALSLISRYPNLLVSRTFSKGRSLAGMRLGAAFGDAALIDGLNRVKNSFNSYPVDTLAHVAGIASLGDEITYRANVERIVATREAFIAALRQRSFSVLPSMANFVFARPADGRAGTLVADLSAAGVLVRHWSSAPISEWLRISIGTDEDMARLLEVLDAADAGTL